MNAGWWIDELLPAVFASAALLAGVILVARRETWPERWVIAAGATGALGTLVVSYFRARRRFVSLAQAQAHLDYALLLHNQLSAAQAGVVAWPAAEKWRAGLWRWNWRRVSLIPCLSALLVIAAFWIPLSAGQRTAAAPTAKPPALEQVEDWLKTLSETPEIDQSSLEQTREQAQQIARQDPSEWYSHASLEAADHLKASLRAGLRSMSDNAAKLESLLGAAEHGAEASDWKQRMQGALSGLEGNVPALSKALASQLREMDPSKLRSLSPEQLKQLKEQLKEGQGACKKCAGGGQKGEEEGDGEPEPGEGGVDRGPGAAPLTLSSKPVNLGTQKTEAIQNEDMSRAALGDQLGTSAGQHDVDRTAEHRAASGGTAAEGAGGGAVWLQQNIAPEERRRLQQFFK